MRTAFFRAALITLLGVLSACTGPAPQPSTSAGSPINSADQIQSLLSEAENSASPAREALQLKAIDLLLEAQQSFLASQILATMQPDILPPALFAHFSSAQARLQRDRGAYEEARSVLEAPHLLEVLDDLPLAQQVELSLLRADIYARLGSHIASAQQRVYLDPLLSADQQRLNREAIWRSLMHASSSELQAYQQSHFSDEFRGWLQLAFIARENQGDLDQQLRQLEQWQSTHADHPAQQELPGGLELIKELAANRPKQVALLLPLSGRLAEYGKAVRDGFIAARYQTQEQGGQVPVLKIYDTEQHANFVELYHQAVAEGAEFIIGPLEKQRLKDLFGLLTLDVPTLALNRGSDFGLPPLNLYQFGLAPQDEARQIAQIAYAENHQRAMIVRPEGEWGDKVSDSFITRWDTLGGHIAAQSIYTGQKDYSSAIKNALLVQDSEARAQRIQNLLGEHIEFSPRRRQDIDMVFMLAHPQQARSLTPLLAYHYAGDIPVYGTSRLYSGYDDPKRDRDINGVRFTDMPWILNSHSPLFQQISRELPQSQQYRRLYALGIDSFQLYPRIRQLEEITNSRVYGQTGTLNLNSENAIERELLFATIDGGRARLIPIADKTDDDATLSGTIKLKDETNDKQQMAKRWLH